MSEDFLPKGYQLPTSESGYMKLQQGENRFRTMSSAITGYEMWVNKKPKRYHEEAQISVEDYEESDKDTYTGEPRLPRHFWAFAVWNYKEERLQILELTQKTVQKQMKAIIADKDWGSPVGEDGYDFVITKSGEKKETEYQVTPKPKAKLDKSIIELYKKSGIDLDELYKGGNPFSKNEKVEDDLVNIFKKE